MDKPKLGPAAPIPGEDVVKIQLFNLVESKDALAKLYVQDLPIKVAYKLSKFIKQANIELESFNEFRTKLLDKYGTKQEDGNSYRLEPQHIREFESEMTALVETELDIEVPTVTLEDLTDAKLAVQDLQVLSYLIKE